MDNSFNNGNNNLNFNNDYNVNGEQEKKEKRRVLFIALIIFFLLVITAVITFPALKKLFTSEQPKAPETQVVANNDKEDAFSEEIKRLMKDLYDKGKSNVIRKILLELGYKDEYIDKIINDYQKIIDAIFNKIRSGEYTEQEVLRIIKRIIDENINNEDKIKELIKELFDKGDKGTIRKVLKDLGYDDDTIKDIIDDYQKIIDAILDKIKSGEKTEQEVIDLIKDKIKETKENMEVIKKLIKDLFDDGDKDTIEKILKDLGYDEDTIKDIIDDYDKIIDAIKKKIDDGEYTEPEIIDIIKKRIDEKKPQPEKTTPTEPEKTTPTNPDTPGDSKTEIDTGKQINVIFENIKLVDGSSGDSIPLLVDNKYISFNIILNAPGDYYAFTADIKNNSNIDVKVDNVISNVLTEEQDKYLGFSLTYDDGSKINKNDVIKVGETRKIKFVSLYKYVDEVNDHDVTASYNGQITFVQK